MSIEFKVSDVELGQKQLSTEATSQALKRIWGDVVVAEADSELAVLIESRRRPHPFVWTVAMAFNNHLPLVITPDMIWLLIVQGVAQAIQQKPEKWRTVSVLHEGKQDIHVEAHELMDCPKDVEIWRRSLNEFAARTRPYLAPPLLQLDTRFSTSTPVTSAVLEVALLDATREFFSLSVHTASGIPSIRLEGTADDWRSIERRADTLREFGLDWWHEALRPLLHEFTRAAQGQVDVRFWRSFFNLDSESGGPILTGWLVRFFPYLQCRSFRDRTGMIERNPSLNEAIGTESGKLWNLPQGLSVAPFTWMYGGQNKAMQWLGGFGGTSQEESGALRPLVAWAVRESTEQTANSA